MTLKGQKQTRKTDQKSIVNISETGYNERQEEPVTEEPIKDFKELDLTNNFMFLAVMKDPELCRPLQAQIDASLLAKGQEYDTLNASYVIFICMKDVFGQGRPIYTFENRCMQDTDIALGDKMAKIFLNPHYKVECVSPELANFFEVSYRRQTGR